MRILFYSLLILFIVACQADKKAAESPNEVAAPAPPPSVETPAVAVKTDAIQEQAANTLKIEPTTAIQEVEIKKDLTKKNVYIPEKAKPKPSAIPKAFGYADLKSKSFKAMGNEPFWNIEIKGEELTFHQMGFEKERYQLAPSQAKSDRLIYTVQAGSGKHALQLELMKAACEDDMSGDAFAFSVILTKDGKEFKGCAKEIFK